MSRRIVSVMITCVVAVLGSLADGAASAATTTGEASQRATTGWLTTSAGGFHTCGIRADRSLWCWGDNSYRQLGLGDGKKRTNPTQVGLNRTWAGLVAGANHTCATRTDHSLWCWGANRDGQLGLGHTARRKTPTRVNTSNDWADVSAAGFAHTCGTRTDHTLWCWGDNEWAGQLGLGDTTDRTTPTQVGTGTDWGRVRAGDTHTCATRTDQTLWCWGYNAVGQLGLGDTVNRAIPTQVGTGSDWTDLAADNGYHTCATRADHSLWCWGFNTQGQLGLGDTTMRTLPTQVGTGTNWEQLTAGHRNSCATRTDHTLWCWGEGLYGQLGLGDTTGRTTPTQVGIRSDWARVTAGARHSCAIRLGQTMWCWGNNLYGQLGLGHTTDRLVPARV